MTNKAGTPDRSTSAEPQFEFAYQELVEIIDRLESGDLSLDESMALFERGRSLIVLCEKHLNSAELRVSQLLSDAEGNLRLDSLG